jgi:hypothetical protein
VTARHCEPIEGSNVVSGWICCGCRTYNGNQRILCKACSHARCNSVRMNCPFCGLYVEAGNNIIEGKPGVLHAQPPCEMFLRLDPADYLEACRKRLAQ